MALCNLDPIEQAKYNRNVQLVGETEAFRDYVAQNGLVRSPEAITKQMEKMLLDSTSDFQYDYRVEMPSFEESLGTNEQVRSKIQSILRQNNRRQSMAAVRSFSERLGIPYEVVTSDVALKMTKDPEVKAFYQGGKVYFVEDRFTSDSVFHEFAHPIVKALAKENPELFQKLYSEIPTEFIRDIQSKYSKTGQYEEGSQEMSEEIMVQSLTQVQAKKTLPKWLENILYHIKQFLRGKMGKKINLRDLSSETTLKEFADMINFGKEFTLDMDFLSEDDFIYFERDFEKYKGMLSDDANIRSKSQALINEFAKIVRMQIDYLKNVKGYNQLQEGLVSEVNNANLLQSMNNILKYMVGEERVDPSGRIEYSLGIMNEVEVAGRLNLLVEQMLRIEKVVDILDQKVDFLKKSNMQEYENLAALHAVTELLQQYAYFLKKVTDTGRVSIFIGSNNPLEQKLNEVMRKIISPTNGVLIKANDIRANIVVDMIYDYVVDTTEEGRKFYENQLKTLKDQGITLEYNRVYKEYTGLYPEEEQELNFLLGLPKSQFESDPKLNARKNELLQMRFASENISRDEFKEYILSDLGDGFVGGKLKWFNRMFESYMLNQDKTVGGFYSFITEKINTIKANANARQNALLGNDELYNKLKAAGWGTLRHIASPQLGQAMGERVDIGKYNESTGEIDSFLEWQFKTGFKDHELHLKRLKQTVKNARNEYQHKKTEDARNALADAEEKLFFHNMYFMNQNMTDDYYIIESILYTGPNARFARWAMDDIYEEINLTGDTDMAIFDMDVAAQRNILFNKLTQLANPYYSDGTLKTGTDAEIAKIIDNYQKARQVSNAFQWELQEDKFRAAYDVAMEEFKSGIVGYDENNPEHSRLFNEKRNRWIELNTTSRVHSVYYDERSQLLERRAEIMKKINDVNAKTFDVSPLYEELYNLNRQMKDSAGQYDGILADPKKIERIKELHELIEEKSLELYLIQNKGLTGTEARELQDLTELEFMRPLTQIESDRLKELQAKRKDGFSRLGLFEEDINALIEIDIELKAIAYSHFTTHYVAEWQRLFDESEDVAQAILSALNEIYHNQGVDLLTDAHTLTAEDIKILLLGENEDHLNSIMQFGEFADWFDRNHFTRKRVQKDKTGTAKEYDIFVPVSIWYKTSPTDKNFYETFDLLDDSGNLVGVLKDKHGIPRVPNANFNIRTPQDSFKNNDISMRDVVVTDANGVQKLKLATQSNKETWLPKSIEQRKSLAYKLLAAQGNISPTEQEIEDFLKTDANFNMDGAGWDRYMNYDYLTMFNENRPMFELTQFVRDWTLDNQMDLHPSERLGVTYPKIRTKGVENVFKKGLIYNRSAGAISTDQSMAENLGAIGRGFKNGRAAQRMFDNFRVREDDAELEMRRLSANDSDDALDKLDRPISGHYAGLDINEISTDIIATAQQNLYSIQENLIYREMNSLAKSFEFALTEWGKPSDEFALNEKGKLINVTSTDKKELSRAKSIQAIIDQHFRGADMALSVNQKGNIAKSGYTHENFQKALWSFVRTGMAWSSRKWFMFNPISGLTNYMSANLQSLYKMAYMDEFFNPADLVVGHVKSHAALGEYSLKSFSAKGKTATMQLMDILDASPDRYMKVIPDAGSRSILKDVATLKFGYASRAYMTNQINYMGMFALMNNRKYRFKIGQKKYTLDQAVELDSKGRIVTKVGTPQEFSISYDAEGKVQFGDKIQKLMKHHKAYLTKIHGMGGKHNEGEYDRYLIGKIVGFIFKWLPGMLGDRYGTRLRFDSRTGVRLQRRFNWNTERYELGVNIQAIKTLQNIFEAPFKKNTWSREQFKGVLALTMVYFMQWFLSFVRHAIMFNGDSSDRRVWLGGTDGDISRLKNVTALPKWSFINPDRTIGDFQTGDFLRLSGSRLLLRVERENASLMPWSVTNMIYGQMVDPASTAGFWKDLGNAFSYIWSGNTTMSPEEKIERELEERGIAFVSDKDATVVGQTSGPFKMQAKGADKGAKLFFNFLGVNGNLIDPYTAYKNESNFYVAPWNPLDYLLGDPKYQPVEPGKLGGDKED